MLGDNLGAGSALLGELRGKVRLIYIDPPFNLGRDFQARIEVDGYATRDIPAYSDTWGPGEESFAHMLWQRLILAREMLTSDGSIFVHCNDHTSPMIRGLLDDVFGPKRFLNEIIWHYTGGGRSRNVFSNKHDTIFWYAKGPRNIFRIDAIREPYKPTSGYAKSGIVSRAGKRYVPHPDGTPADDVWDIPMVNPMAGERTCYPTQKPLRLLERIIAVASNEGDVVVDLFAGSGTTAIAAEKLRRNWVVFERSLLGVSIARHRLLVEGARFALMHDASLLRSSPKALANIEQQNDTIALRDFSMSPEPLKRTGNARSASLVSNWGIGLRGSEGELTLSSWAPDNQQLIFKTHQKHQSFVRIVIYDVFGRRWEQTAKKQGNFMVFESTVFATV